MVVVSNTSPIVNLAAIGHLHLLRDVFGAILIPDAVHHEIVGQGAGRPGAEEVARATWITRKAVREQHLVRMLEREIHVGEAEALVLAVETDADWVLLDERAARDNAETLGLSYMGLLGVLARAKRDGLIPSIRPLLDALRAHGFWVSEALYEYVLAQMGEAP